MPGTLSPALLALPGWDDDGRQQFEALRGQLGRDGWVCQRAHLPDSSWTPQERARTTREDTLRQTLDDYFALESDARVQPGRITVLGFSFGAYMAAYLSSARPVHGLILRSPAIYPDTDWQTPKEELDKRDLDLYRHRFLTPADNKALACCARFEGDVLLVDSERDQIIPPPVITSYAAAFQRVRSLTRYTLEGADHQLTDPAWQEAYHRVVVEWLHERKQ